jgi:hypothetical protein
VKRIVLTAALLLGATFAAQADINTWHDTTGRSRSNAALQVDANYCTWVAGHDRNGTPTTPQFKRCMLSRGWRLIRTKYEPQQDESDYHSALTGRITEQAQP